MHMVFVIQLTCRKQDPLIESPTSIPVLSQAFLSHPHEGILQIVAIKGGLFPFLAPQLARRSIAHWEAFKCQCIVAMHFKGC